MASREAIEEPEDPVRTFTTEETERLTVNLLGIHSDIRAGVYASRPLDLALVCELHRRLFDGVRSHAGKHRAKGFGQEHVSFGPHRSLHRSKVEKELTAVLLRAERKANDIARAEDAKTRIAGGLAHALQTHADIVRIHPFEDGNGRTSRAVMDILLCRLGLRPVAFEVPRNEYLGALNHYYEQGALQPLVDLSLRALFGQ